MDNISVKPVTQFRIVLANEPGALAKIAKAFALGGVNLEGFVQIIENSKEAGAVRFVTMQVEAARETLSSLSLSFVEEKILSLRYPDKPGVVAEVAEAFGNAGINIEDMYLSTPGGKKDTVLYVGVSEKDLPKATDIALNL